MKCPKCGNEMKKGVAEARELGSLTQFHAAMLWYPEEENGKWRKRKLVNLWLKGEGYYCDTCMKVFACFEEKA